MPHFLVRGVSQARSGVEVDEFADRGPEAEELTPRGMFAPKAGGHGLGKSGGDQEYVIPTQK